MATKRRPGRPRELDDPASVGVHFERRDLDDLRAWADKEERTLSSLIRELANDRLDIERKIWEKEPDSDPRKRRRRKP